MIVHIAEAEVVHGEIYLFYIAGTEAVHRELYFPFSFVSKLSLMYALSYLHNELGMLAHT